MSFNTQQCDYLYRIIDARRADSKDITTSSKKRTKLYTGCVEHADTFTGVMKSHIGKGGISLAKKSYDIDSARSVILEEYPELSELKKSDLLPICSALSVGHWDLLGTELNKFRQRFDSTDITVSQHNIEYVRIVGDIALRFHMFGVLKSFAQDTLKYILRDVSIDKLLSMIDNHPMLEYTNSSNSSAILLLIADVLEVIRTQPYYQSFIDVLKAVQSKYTTLE
jgi:hypothetical protein